MARPVENRERRRLTLRSTGRATAGGVWASFHSGPNPARRRLPLNSNVSRPQKLVHMSNQIQAPSAVETKIRHLEERLRQAMLKSEVAELDALIDDRLLFIGPDSAVYSKKDDLELHRSGAERIARLDVEELRIEIYPSLAIVILLANMAGVVNGQAFEGRFRYMRTWAPTADDWRVVAGSVCILPA